MSPSTYRTAVVSLLLLTLTPESYCSKYPLANSGFCSSACRQ
jgi:hypothetical protein